MLHSDRKSTRLNSSHLVISYAVFCLKKNTIPYCYRTEHPGHGCIDASVSLVSRAPSRGLSNVGTDRCASLCSSSFPYSFFFFNDAATPDIYPLPLHDALPICGTPAAACGRRSARSPERRLRGRRSDVDRKSTRLNSSHLVISYAVCCLKK